MEEKNGDRAEGIEERERRDIRESRKRVYIKRERERERRERREREPPTGPDWSRRCCCIDRASVAHVTSLFTGGSRQIRTLIINSNITTHESVTNTAVRSTAKYKYIAWHRVLPSNSSNGMTAAMTER